MKRTISMSMILCLLSSSFGYAVSAPNAAVRSKRIVEYQQATARTHPRYLAKIEAIKTRLRQRIPSYVFGSFYGACPTDTLWAKAIVQNPEAMVEIYAENQIERRLDAQPVQIAFSISEGEIFFQDVNTLGRYKADPGQHSVIQMTSTQNGPRVAASTVLTEEGMALQATAGCAGCHSL